MRMILKSFDYNAHTASAFLMIGKKKNDKGKKKED